MPVTFGRGPATEKRSSHEKAQDAPDEFGDALLHLFVALFSGLTCALLHESAASMMKVTSTEFIKSAFEETDWPGDRKPEIAFLGRSNVGKSSFINSLLGVRGLARTSSTPGRTQSVNFFLINGKFRFVDLPGYGYARAPRDVKAKWSAAATDYLAKRDQLVLSIHIVDSRHEPTKQDLQLHEWLEHHQKPHTIVATKSDKLSSNELRRNIELAKRAFKNERIVVYSAVSGRGHDDAWNAIQAALRHAKNS